MKDEQILGMAGGGLLIIGLFLPIFSIPLLETRNYFAYSTGEASILLLLGLVSIGLAAANRHGWLWLTAVLAALIMGHTAYKPAPIVAKGGDGLSGLLNQLAAGAVEHEWGWLILGFGCLLMLAAAVLKARASSS